MLTIHGIFQEQMRSVGICKEPQSPDNSSLYFKMEVGRVLWGSVHNTSL